MANTSSAKKEIRAAGRKSLRNKPLRSAGKTRVTKAEGLLAKGDLEKASAAVLSAVSTLDKAAEKGIIHPNNAARRKSRLMKKLNAKQAAAEAKPEEKK